MNGMNNNIFAYKLYTYVIRFDMDFIRMAEWMVWIIFLHMYLR